MKNGNSRDHARIVDTRNASYFRNYPGEGLTPQKLSSILKGMDAGHCAEAMNFFDEMEEKDPHLSAVMQTRIMAAAGRARVVNPAGSDAASLRHASFVREVWDALDGKTALLHDLLAAIGRGFSIAEMVHEVRGGMLTVSKVNFCPQSLFTFANPDDPMRLLEFPRYMEPGNPRGVEIPRDKFIFHTCRSPSGGPLRSGLYRGLSWYFMFTNYSIKDWLTFMDLYGVPLRIGRFKANTDDASREMLRHAVQNLGTDAAAVISDDTVIEFIESKLSGSHDLFQNAVEFFDRQKSKRVLGQTLTTEAGAGGSGSRALGQVHDRVRNDITRLDCVMLDETLTRDFIVPLVKANFGTQRRYPVFVSDAEGGEERGLRLEALKKAFEMGVAVPAAEVYAAAGIALPADGGAPK